MSIDQYFGPDKPALVRGPIIPRDEVRAPGMILRFLRADKTGDQRIYVFQLPNAVGTVFSLWHTQQLGAKLKNTRRGEVVLLIYAGQSDDDDKVHQWNVRPFSGTPLELQTIVRQTPWVEWIPAFSTMIGEHARTERARRAQTGDGAPKDEPRNDYPW